MVLQIYVDSACLESWLPVVSPWIIGGGGMKINTPVLFGELQYYNDQGLTVVIRTVWELHKYQQRQGAS